MDLFRFGGDEFLIIMSSAGEKEANILINRISEKLDGWNSRKTEYNIKISLSIGYSVLQEDRSLEEIIDEADKMMYEKKQLHRDAKD